MVYRDIKPENILLAADGHVKIADLGLAKPNMENRKMAYSFCGSPEYMSPEMIMQYNLHYIELAIPSLSTIIVWEPCCTSCSQDCLLSTIKTPKKYIKLSFKNL